MSRRNCWRWKDEFLLLSHPEFKISWPDVQVDSNRKFWLSRFVARYCLWDFLDRYILWARLIKFVLGWFDPAERWETSLMSVRSCNLSIHCTYFSVFLLISVSVQWYGQLKSPINAGAECTDIGRHLPNFIEFLDPVRDIAQRVNIACGIRYQKCANLP